MAELIDRRLLAFLLYDWLAVDRLPERERFSDHSRADFDAVIDAADVLAQREFAPHNRLSDEHEPQFVDGRVRIIPDCSPAPRFPGHHRLRLGFGRRRIGFVKGNQAAPEGR